MFKKSIIYFLLLTILITFPAFYTEAALVPSEQRDLPTVSRNRDYIDPYYAGISSGSVEFPVYEYTAHNNMIITKAHITLRINNSSSARGTWYVYNGEGELLATRHKGSDYGNYYDDVIIYPYSTTLYFDFRGGATYKPSLLEINANVILSADVADNATVIQARNAANAAKSSAETAATRAQTAATNAANAKASADTASARAQNAVNQTWYTGAFGGNTDSVANLAGYIRNTQLPGLENKITNLETTVNNIQNIDNTPVTVDVQTVSGARATSGSSIPAIVTANKTGALTYSINGGSYVALPPDGRVNLPVTSSGNNAITVTVRDASGNVGSKTIVIRKL